MACSPVSPSHLYVVVILCASHEKLRRMAGFASLSDYHVTNSGYGHRAQRGGAGGSEDRHEQHTNVRERKGHLWTSD